MPTRRFHFRRQSSWSGVFVLTGSATGEVANLLVTGLLATRWDVMRPVAIFGSDAQAVAVRWSPDAIEVLVAASPSTDAGVWQLSPESPGASRFILMRASAVAAERALWRRYAPWTGLITGMAQAPPNEAGF